MYFSYVSCYKFTHCGCPEHKERQDTVAHLFCLLIHYLRRAYAARCSLWIISKSTAVLKITKSYIQNVHETIQGSVNIFWTCTFILQTIQPYPNLRNDIHFKVSKIELWCLCCHLYVKWEHIAQSLVYRREQKNRCLPRGPASSQNPLFFYFILIVLFFKNLFLSQTHNFTHLI